MDAAEPENKREPITALAPTSPIEWWHAISDRLDLAPARLALGAAALVATFAAAWWSARPDAPMAAVVLPSATSTTAVAATEEMFVHVAGAVARPGVYRLAAGARVADAIEAAGGAAADADLDRTNLAAPVTDGSQVFVVRRGEAAPAGATSPAGQSADTIIDLNTASVEELDSLPGIGPATAQAIVDHRTENGPFKSVEELLEVRGIGEAKLAQIRKRVRV